MITLKSTTAWILLCVIITVSSTSTNNSPSNDGASHPRATTSDHQQNAVPGGIQIPESLLSSQDVAFVTAESSIFEIITKSQETCIGNDMSCTFYHLNNNSYENLGTYSLNKEKFNNLIMQYESWWLTAKSNLKKVPPALLEQKLKQEKVMTKNEGIVSNENVNNIDIGSNIVDANKNIDIKKHHHTRKLEGHHTHHHKDNSQIKTKNINYIKLEPEYNDEHKYFEVFLPKDDIETKPRTIYVEVDNKENEFVLVDEAINKDLQGNKPVKVELDEITTTDNDNMNYTYETPNIDARIMNTGITPTHPDNEDLKFLEDPEKNIQTPNKINTNSCNINCNQKTITDDNTGEKKNIINVMKNIAVPNQYVNQAQFCVQTPVDTYDINLTPDNIPNDINNKDESPPTIDTDTCETLTTEDIKIPDANKNDKSICEVENSVPDIRSTKNDDNNSDTLTSYIPNDNDLVCPIEKPIETHDSQSNANVSDPNSEYEYNSHNIPKDNLETQKPVSYKHIPMVRKDLDNNCPMNSEVIPSDNSLSNHDLKYPPLPSHVYENKSPIYSTPQMEYITKLLPTLLTNVSPSILQSTLDENSSPLPDYVTSVTKEFSGSPKSIPAFRPALEEPSISILNKPCFKCEASYNTFPLTDSFETVSKTSNDLTRSSSPQNLHQSDFTNEGITKCSICNTNSGVPSITKDVLKPPCTCASQYKPSNLEPSVFYNPNSDTSSSSNTFVNDNLSSNKGSQLNSYTPNIYQNILNDPNLSYRKPWQKYTSLHPNSYTLTPVIQNKIPKSNNILEVLPTGYIPLSLVYTPPNLGFYGSQYLRPTSLQNLPSLCSDSYAKSWSPFSQFASSNKRLDQSPTFPYSSKIPVSKPSDVPIKFELSTSIPFDSSQKAPPLDFSSGSISDTRNPQENTFLSNFKPHQPSNLGSAISYPEVPTTPPSKPIFDKENQTQESVKIEPSKDFEQTNNLTKPFVYPSPDMSESTKYKLKNLNQKDPSLYSSNNDIKPLESSLIKPNSEAENSKPISNFVDDETVPTPENNLNQNKPQGNLASTFKAPSPSQTNLNSKPSNQNSKLNNNIDTVPQKIKEPKIIPDTSLTGPSIYNIGGPEGANAFEYQTPLDSHLIGPSLYQNSKPDVSSSPDSNYHIDSSLIGPSLFQNTGPPKSLNPFMFDSSLTGPSLFSNDNTDAENLQENTNSGSFLNDYINKLKKYTKPKESPPSENNNDVNNFLPSDLIGEGLNLNSDLSKYNNPYTSNTALEDNFLPAIGRSSAESSELVPDLQSSPQNTFLYNPSSTQNDGSSSFVPLQRYSPISPESYSITNQNIKPESYSYNQGLPRSVTNPKMLPINSADQSNIKKSFNKDIKFGPQFPTRLSPINWSIPQTPFNIKPAFKFPDYSSLIPLSYNSPRPITSDFKTPCFEASTSNMNSPDTYFISLPKESSFNSFPDKESTVCSPEFKSVSFNDIISLLKDNNYNLVDISKLSETQSTVPLVSKEAVNPPCICQSLPDTDLTNTEPVFSAPSKTILTSSVYTNTQAENSQDTAPSSFRPFSYTSQYPKYSEPTQSQHSLSNFRPYLYTPQILKYSEPTQSPTSINLQPYSYTSQNPKFSELTQSQTSSNLQPYLYTPQIQPDKETYWSRTMSDNGKILRPSISQYSLENQAMPTVRPQLNPSSYQNIIVQSPFSSSISELNTPRTNSESSPENQEFKTPKGSFYELSTFPQDAKKLDTGSLPKPSFELQKYLLSKPLDLNTQSPITNVTKKIPSQFNTPTFNILSKTKPQYFEPKSTLKTAPTLAQLPCFDSTSFKTFIPTNYPCLRKAKDSKQSMIYPSYLTHSRILTSPSEPKLCDYLSPYPLIYSVKPYPQRTATILAETKPYVPNYLLSAPIIKPTLFSSAISPCLSLVNELPKSISFPPYYFNVTYPLISYLPTYMADSSTDFKNPSVYTTPLKSPFTPDASKYPPFSIEYRNQYPKPISYTPNNFNASLNSPYLQEFTNECPISNSYSSTPVYISINNLNNPCQDNYFTPSSMLHKAFTPKLPQKNTFTQSPSYISNDDIPKSMPNSSPFMYQIKQNRSSPKVWSNNPISEPVSSPESKAIPSFRSTVSTPVSTNVPFSSYSGYIPSSYNNISTFIPVTSSTNFPKTHQINQELKSQKYLPFHINIPWVGYQPIFHLQPQKIEPNIQYTPNAMPTQNSYSYEKMLPSQMNQKGSHKIIPCVNDAEYNLEASALSERYPSYNDNNFEENYDNTVTAESDILLETLAHILKTEDNAKASLKEDLLTQNELSNSNLPPEPVHQPKMYQEPQISSFLSTPPCTGENSESSPKNIPEYSTSKPVSYILPTSSITPVYSISPSSVTPLIDGEISRTEKPSLLSYKPMAQTPSLVSHSPKSPSFISSLISNDNSLPVETLSYSSSKPCIPQYSIYPSKSPNIFPLPSAQLPFTYYESKPYIYTSQIPLPKPSMTPAPLTSQSYIQSPLLYYEPKLNTPTSQIPLSKLTSHTPQNIQLPPIYYESKTIIPTSQIPLAIPSPIPAIPPVTISTSPQSLPKIKTITSLQPEFTFPTLVPAYISPISEERFNKPSSKYPTHISPLNPKNINSITPPLTPITIYTPGIPSLPPQYSIKSPEVSKPILSTSTLNYPGSSNIVNQLPNNIPFFTLKNPSPSIVSSSSIKPLILSSPQIKLIPNTQNIKIPTPLSNIKPVNYYQYEIPSFTKDFSQLPCLNLPSVTVEETKPYRVISKPNSPQYNFPNIPTYNTLSVGRHVPEAFSYPKLTSSDIPLLNVLNLDAFKSYPSPITSNYPLNSSSLLKPLIKSVITPKSESSIQVNSVPQYIPKPSSNLDKISPSLQNSLLLKPLINYSQNNLPSLSAPIPLQSPPTPNEIPTPVCETTSSSIDFSPLESDESPSRILPLPPPTTLSPNRNKIPLTPATKEYKSHKPQKTSEISPSSSQNLPEIDIRGRPKYVPESEHKFSPELSSQKPSYPSFIPKYSSELTPCYKSPSLLSQTSQYSKYPSSNSFVLEDRHDFSTPKVPSQITSILPQSIAPFDIKPLRSKLPLKSPEIQSMYPYSYISPNSSPTYTNQKENTPINKNPYFERILTPETPEELTNTNQEYEFPEPLPFALPLVGTPEMYQPTEIQAPIIPHDNVNEGPVFKEAVIPSPKNYNLPPQYNILEIDNKPLTYEKPFEITQTEIPTSNNNLPMNIISPITNIYNEDYISLAIESTKPILTAESLTKVPIQAKLKTITGNESPQSPALITPIKENVIQTADTTSQSKLGSITVSQSPESTTPIIPIEGTIQSIDATNQAKLNPITFVQRPKLNTDEIPIFVEPFAESTKPIEPAESLIKLIPNMKYKKDIKVYENEIQPCQTKPFNINIDNKYNTYEDKTLPRITKNFNTPNYFIDVQKPQTPTQNNIKENSPSIYTIPIKSQPKYETPNIDKAAPSIAKEIDQKYPPISTYTLNTKYNLDSTPKPIYYYNNLPDTNKPEIHETVSPNAKNLDQKYPQISTYTLNTKYNLDSTPKPIYYYNNLPDTNKPEIYETVSPIAKNLDQIYPPISTYTLNTKYYLDSTLKPIYFYKDISDTNKPDVYETVSPNAKNLDQKYPPISTSTSNTKFNLDSSLKPIYFYNDISDTNNPEIYETVSPIAKNLDQKYPPISTYTLNTKYNLDSTLKPIYFYNDIPNTNKPDNSKTYINKLTYPCSITDTFRNTKDNIKISQSTPENFVSPYSELKAEIQSPSYSSESTENPCFNTPYMKYSGYKTYLIPGIKTSPKIQEEPEVYSYPLPSYTSKYSSAEPLNINQKPSVKYDAREVTVSSISQPEVALPQSKFSLNTLEESPKLNVYNAIEQTPIVQSIEAALPQAKLDLKTLSVGPKLIAYETPVHVEIPKPSILPVAEVTPQANLIPKAISQSSISNVFSPIVQTTRAKSPDTPILHPIKIAPQDKFGLNRPSQSPNLNIHNPTENTLICPELPQPVVTSQPQAIISSNTYEQSPILNVYNPTEEKPRRIEPAKPFIIDLKVQKPCQGELNLNFIRQSPILNVLSPQIQTPAKDPIIESVEVTLPQPKLTPTPCNQSPNSNEHNPVIQTQVELPKPSALQSVEPTSQAELTSIPYSQSPNSNDYNPSQENIIREETTKPFILQLQEIRPVQGEIDLSPFYQRPISNVNSRPQEKPISVEFPRPFILQPDEIKSVQGDLNLNTFTQSPISDAHNPKDGPSMQVEYPKPLIPQPAALTLQANIYPTPCTQRLKSNEYTSTVKTPEYTKLPQSTIQPVEVTPQAKLRPIPCNQSPNLSDYTPNPKAEVVTSIQGDLSPITFRKSPNFNVIEAIEQKTICVQSPEAQITEPAVVPQPQAELTLIPYNQRSNLNVNINPQENLIREEPKPFIFQPQAELTPISYSQSPNLNEHTPVEQSSIQLEFIKPFIPQPKALTLQAKLKPIPCDQSPNFNVYDAIDLRPIYLELSKTPILQPDVVTSNQGDLSSIACSQSSNFNVYDAIVRTPILESVEATIPQDKLSPMPCNQSSELNVSHSIVQSPICVDAPKSLTLLQEKVPPQANSDLNTWNEGPDSKLIELPPIFVEYSKPEEITNVQRESTHKTSSEGPNSNVHNPLEENPIFIDPQTIETTFQANLDLNTVNQSPISNAYNPIEPSMNEYKTQDIPILKPVEVAPQANLNHKALRQSPISNLKDQLTICTEYSNPNILESNKILPNQSEMSLNYMNQGPISNVYHLPQEKPKSVEPVMPFIIEIKEEKPVHAEWNFNPCNQSPNSITYNSKPICMDEKNHEFITHISKYINDNKNKLNEITIPINNIIIDNIEAKPEIIETTNPSIGLKVWESKVKLIQAEVKLKFKDLSVINFMPIAKADSFNHEIHETLKNVVKNYINETYGRHIEISEPHNVDNQYTVIKDLDFSNTDNKFNLLWPTYYV